jgi:hypothetical protein
MTCKNCRSWQQILAPLALFLTYEKNASTFTSSPFDFVATGLRAIQFLLDMKFSFFYGFFIVFFSGAI